MIMVSEGAISVCDIVILIMGSVVITVEGILLITERMLMIVVGVLKDTAGPISIVVIMCMMTHGDNCGDHVSNYCEHAGGCVHTRIE